MLIFGWFIISFISKFKYAYICKFEKEIWKLHTTLSFHRSVVYIVRLYLSPRLHMPSICNILLLRTHYIFARITVVFYLTDWLTFDFDIYINSYTLLYRKIWSHFPFSILLFPNNNILHIRTIPSLLFSWFCILLVVYTFKSHIYKLIV